MPESESLPNPPLAFAYVQSRAYSPSASCVISGSLSSTVGTGTTWVAVCVLESSDDSTLVSDHGVPIVVLENPNRV